MMRYCILHNLGAYFGWSHDLHDHLSCLITCNSLKAQNNKLALSSTLNLESTRSAAHRRLLKHYCGRKWCRMCAYNINLNSYGTLHGEGGEWTQTFKAGGLPNYSRDKEQVPVSTDWDIGNSLQVSACLKKKWISSNCREYLCMPKHRSFNTVDVSKWTVCKGLPQITATSEDWHKFNRTR